ncbi:metallophosphoesterase [bacterium]|nr:metallophosphoesterase [bacterium]
MRIVVAADLHLEITGKEPIRHLVASIEHEGPDLLVLAGDLGNPSMLFSESLAEFLKLDCPVLVLTGNHDLWNSPTEKSRELFDETLPKITARAGFFWLDGDKPFIAGNIGVAGSLGWYDYSAKDPSRELSDEEILGMKSRFAMDADRIDWEETDQEFAAECRDRLERQLEALEGDDRVEKVLVVTHVPIFENQIDRRPNDEHWSLGNPFFAHLTMGEQVRKFPKVRWTVSGHTHVGMNGVVERDGMAPIATAVIGSDYYKPAHVIVDTE